ncbi:MAG: hypothetical protein R3B47_15500 [Bacteroidia bacterium]
MYAPDRARMHEWAGEHATEEPGQKPHGTARPFSLMAFYPPMTANGGGTGALDTKVQIIVSQHFSLAEQIRNKLRPKTRKLNKKQAPVSLSSQKQPEAPIKESQHAKNQPESILYQSSQGAQIPISISAAQRALFVEKAFLHKAQPEVSADPLGGFKLRPVDELENAKPDESVQASIHNAGLPLSETMAKLLANQGDVRDAISIYEQLILANPEKNAYFTAQIEKIQQL